MKNKECPVKRHVHIYAVVAMQELDIEAENREAVRKSALESALQNPLAFKPADTKLIALDFPIDTGT